MAQHMDLAAADIDTRLYDAARRFAATFSSGLPVYELRPALCQDMSQLCASVLQVDDVAVRDPLIFESLQAVTLQSIVQAGTGLSLPLDRLLDGANVEELTEVVLCEAAGDPAESSDLDSGSLLRVMPDPDQRFEPFPLTDVQQAYLLGRDASYELGNVTSTFYAEVETVDLDLDLVEAAFNELIERHDALRTVFRADGYQQVLADVPRYHVVREDVSGLDASASAERLEQVRAELSDCAFAVDTWPLFELRATRRDDRHTRLHLAFDLLITDGASIARLLTELSQRYEQPGRVWSGLELSFRDYQVAVQGVVGSGRFERARGYWLGRLEGLAAAPQLPLARALSSVSRPRFSRRSFVLDAAGWAGLRARAGRYGLTPSVVLLAAYAQVLAQWSASARFTVNVTVNSRLPLHRQVNELVGDFTALTLLEVDAADGAGFAEFAARLQRRLWTDLDHREFSGVRVLRELARRRGATNTAMPVVFTSTVDGGAELVGGPLGKVVDGVVHTPQVYLDHQAFRLGDGLALAWDVVEEVFPVGLVDAMFGAYCGLVSGLASSEGLWGGSVGSLVPAGQVAVRSVVNGTEVVRGSVLVHRLGGWLAGRGSGVAVLGADRVLSYGELDRAATRVGRRLRQVGVGCNELVGVVMDKGWEQVVAALGVLYCGAAYLPVDAGLPVARIGHLLARGGCTVVLTQSRFVTGLAWPDGVRVWAVDDPAQWAGVEETPLVDRQNPTDLAYVIFTSGSTGEPKGVMIDHRGAANTIADINHRYQIGPDDRVLALSSLSFDLSVWDVFGILAAGGAVVIPEPGAQRDPQRWADLLCKHRVTVWNTVPALMDMLITHADTDRDTDLGSLRVVLLSGDWIPLSLPERILRHADPAHLASLGGATEVSIWSIQHPITVPLDPAWPSIPYGTPLTNQTCHVLDDALQPRPDWVPGHFYIGGAGLAHGYWRDPDRTNAAFIHHPATGQRLYHTGDLARYHPDGRIEFLGRADTQIKLNGYRIELGEIEATLTQHPTITHAVVTHTNKHLTAYVTTAASIVDMNALTPELLDLCGRNLPEWMVPARVVHLEELPLSSNGKVDRSALPTDVPSEPDRNEAFVAPRSEPERILHEIWCDLLGREAVSVFEDFASAGGDSLLALQVIHRAGARGLRISPQVFFAHPTIADLAVFAGPGPATEIATLSGGDVSGPVPLTPRQVAFLATYPEPPSHWHYTMLFELAEPLERTALRVALRAVLRHHDGLRITFHRAGQWTARIRPADETELPFTWFDLTDLPAPDQRDAVRRACRDLQARIDLAGPMLQVAYFRTAPVGPDRLFVAGHWLMWDNYSCRIFLDDLLGGHDQVIAQGEVRLAQSTPLALWSQQLTARAESAEVSAERDLWRSVASTSAPLPRKADATNNTEDARTVIAALGPEATARLANWAAGESTTTADVLLAAVARAIAGWSDRDRVHVELDGHGRNRPDIAADPSRTIGRLSTRRPLEVRIHPDDNLSLVARQITTSRAAAPMDGANFDLLAYVAGDAELLAARGEVLFNYLGRVDSLLPPDRLRLAEDEPGAAHASGVPREHLIEFLAGSIDDDTLVACTYGALCHSEEIIKAVVLAALDDVRASCSVPAPVDSWMLPPVVKSLHHLLAAA